MKTINVWAIISKDKKYKNPICRIDSVLECDKDYKFTALSIFRTRELARRVLHKARSKGLTEKCSIIKIKIN